MPHTPAASPLAIQAELPMPWQAFNAHSGAHVLRAPSDWLDPFIGVDSYTITGPSFGPHPHAGMSAVSLMLPESCGSLRNRDTLGDDSLIHPGDLHWFQAGRGAMHEEEPVEPGAVVRGLQVFVNLSRVHKQSQPKAFRVRADDIACVALKGAKVRVVSGEFAGQRSPLESQLDWHTRVTMLDLSLDAGAQLVIPVAPGHRSFFVAVEGSLVSSRKFDAPCCASVFDKAREDPTCADWIHLQAGHHPLRGVMFSGRPLNEPVVLGGPFTGNSTEDILAWREAFYAGEMGDLSPSFSGFS